MPKSPMNPRIWPVSQFHTHGPLIAWRVMDMASGVSLVSFPSCLNESGTHACLRAYAFVDLVRGRPVDPYIVAELARH